MLSDELEEHLRKKLLPFWKALRDEEFGGYYGLMDAGLLVDRRAEKGCILNSRILWFFSNAHMCLGEGEGLKEYADWAYRFLRDHCLDREAGGVFWSMDYKGNPLDTTKHTYNQAFAVYALSSYYRAFGEEEAFRLAAELVELIENRCFEPGGYLEAQDRLFHPVDNEKLSENGVMAWRTMNTLLHVLEAYTEYLLACRERNEGLAAGAGALAANCAEGPAGTKGLAARAGEPAVNCAEGLAGTEGLAEGAGVPEGAGDWETAGGREFADGKKAAEKLRWILNLIATRVYHSEKHRQEVFFDKEMNSLLDLHSYGHDIEAAWLMDRSLKVLGDPYLRARLAPMLRDLEEEIFRTAFDGHSLANECDRGRVDTKRIWWVQAEGVVGFYNAWQETGNRRYLQASESLWEYIRTFLVDNREGGEWFWYVTDEGAPALDKPVVEPWKCPYHNGRMCMEIIRRKKMEPCPKYYEELEKQEKLIRRKNEVDPSFYNGIFSRYKYPVLTREHIPLFWRYDLNPETNPYFMERLGVNAVMNSGAIYLDGRFYLVARVEGNDRKSFFAVAESPNGIDNFRFWDYPVTLPDTCPEETNVYDMRLTLHEDGYIYGVFCSESKDASSSDLSAAVAAAGIVRTRDLKTWERLPNLKTLRSPQQRNVVLHPEFVDGKYAFYTRPMDDFIETGSGGGIGFGLCEDITHAVIDEERITSCRRYHTITESKNGAGAVPIKTPRGWIHIAHGVRNTAAGLRYVIYAFATSLEDPAKVIAEPSGLLIGPRAGERVGDVSNVVFTNGAVTLPDGRVYIYYASSDTRMHVAVTDLERLEDYVFHTPQDPLRSPDCVKQRCALIEKNLAFINRP